MHFRISWFLGPSLCLLAGCNTIPETAKGPLPPNAASLLAMTMKASLKDPYSVRDPAYVIIQEKGVHYACVQLNAKNSFGGYAGMTRFFFIWNGSQWVSNAAMMGMEDFRRQNGMGVGTCPEATKPFNEMIS